MGTTKKGIIISIIAFLLVLCSASLLIYYKEDSKRNPANFVYESNMDADHVVSDNQIVLKVSDSETMEKVDFEAEDDLKAGYLFQGQGTVTWEFELKESQSYYISAGYLPLAGNGGDIQFELLIDGVKVSTDEKIITLSRLWTDLGDFTRATNGDETRPQQKEVYVWTEENFKYNSKTDLYVNLKPGKHTIEITNTAESCMLDFIRLFTKNTVSYKEYIGQIEASNINSEYLQTIEAEIPYMKSSLELYPIYDKSSPYTTPYNSTSVRYNTIGGGNWADEGQWIEWIINAPSDGFYQIGMRFRQNMNKGVVSTRAVTIDGEMPFKELEGISFDYSINWQAKYLGDSQPYLFYLTEGEHTIRMDVVMGELADLTENMKSTVNKLNSLYRDIIMITGTNPDIYRDFNLQTAIPDLVDNMSASITDLESYIDYLEKKYGKNSYASRVIAQLKRQLESFTKKPYTIQKRLSVFKTNISSLAEWVISFEEQPLELDSFYITGVGKKIPKAEANLLGKVGHEIRAFFGSFTHNYNVVSSSAENTEGTTITIWLNRGRDQANVIKRLIDNYFTKETGINVNLSLVDGALVKAAIAGKGPDVNIFTSRGEAMNLAFRGALLPIDNLDGFDELYKQYMDNAFLPYQYDGAIYGIVEEQVFYMMFVRTDIMDNFGLEIPKTWDELMKIMPVLQGNNLEIGLPYTDGYATMNSGIGTINILPTLLAQRGINIYNEDNSKTLLASSEAYHVFKMWTDFYTMYDFSLYKDDFNRFRTGEMPILIFPYGLYNALSEAAPEIAGEWIMTTVPGTLNSKGELNISTSASGSCSIILKDCDDKDAAWEFVKWWNSPEIQTQFSKDIEAELSALGRYTPANLEAFANTSWYDEEKELLMKQWKSVVEIPEIPGGYYTSRNIDNAFRAVFYNGDNARESLYYWVNSINEELLRKQNQIKARKED